jgi:sRNA-binding protein
MTMPPLTDAERDERLLTPYERHQRDLEQLRASRPDYGGWASAEMQREQAARAARELEREQAAVAARKKRDDERRAERERIAREAGAAELAAYKERVRAAWLDNGGTVASFEAEWPTLSKAYVRERALEQPTRDERRVEELVARGRAEGGFGRL